MTLKRYIGDKAFYKAVLTIAVPMMIQTGINNFVSLLDNLMIGRLGTNSLSGVAIANQIIFVYYLLIFGATAGVGIFTAQYQGIGNVDGVRDTFRMKVMTNLVLAALAITFLYFYTAPLIGLFLKGEGSASDASETLQIGSQYMRIMLIGLVPLCLTNAYSGTLRDTGQTRIPMLAAMISAFVNLIGNLLLIYGLCGFPALGARGAAIATVIARFVELSFLVIYTGTHSAQHPFIIGAFRHLTIPRRLALKFFVRALPLIINETLWSLGQTTMNQCYSYRSLSAVAALNIESTLWMFLSVTFLALGEAAGIVTGQTLGSGNFDKARDEAYKLRAFTIACGILGGIFMLVVSPYFPLLYNTTEDVRHLASGLIFAYGLLMPFYAYTHVSYFILRSGGNSLITFLFDGCFVWLVSVPGAFIVSHFTAVPVITMIIIVQSLELVKCIIGGYMVTSGIWIRNIVADSQGG